MTIDEALREIGQAEHCWVVWREDTGEILAVTRLHSPDSPEEMLGCLESLQRDFPFPVIGVFLSSADLTRESLEDQARKLARARDGMPDYNELANQTTVRLIEILESRAYKPPMNAVSGSRWTVKHLYHFRRSELEGSLRERLRVLAAARGALVPAVAQMLTWYLAALDGDRDSLIAMWKSEWPRRPTPRQMPIPIWDPDLPDRRTMQRMQALMECAGFLRIADPSVIDDLIQTVEWPGLFSLRYQAMVTLGQIGAPAGRRAVERIRSVIYGSSPRVTAVRERACERILTPEDAWVECGECDRGGVLDTHSDPPTRVECSVCVGLGFVRK